MYKLYIETWLFGKHDFGHSVLIESYNTFADAQEAMEQHDEVLCRVYQTYIVPGSSKLFKIADNQVEKAITFKILKRNGLEA